MALTTRPALMKFAAYGAAMALFAVAYAAINDQLLIHRVLYRLAANDPGSALWNMIALAVQAGILLVAIILLPNRWFAAVVVVIGVSAPAFMAYQQVLQEPMGANGFAWLWGERRTAGQALGTFLPAIGITAIKLVLALACLLMVRRLTLSLRQRRIGAVGTFGILAALVLVHLMLPRPIQSSIGNERALYVYALHSALAAPPPDRAAVDLAVAGLGYADKIVWLIDESVSYDAYRRLLAPATMATGAVDYGPAASMGHCSTPANVALRSGVSVDTVSSETDLRATASIWGYARHAGYETLLIDGQVSGAPQNMLLEPERALIGTYLAIDAGYDTDRAIATRINRELRKPGKRLIVAIMAGAHFQYRDHYPPGTVAEGAPLAAQYDAAVAYSKRDVFAKLLDEVDRSAVAIFYTSDHGQNVQGLAPPHCSADPVHAEYEVPLVAFMPDIAADMLAPADRKARSHSQLFPSSLWLMGYRRESVEERYDTLLAGPPRSYIAFGRAVVPTRPGDAIDVTRGRSFPGR